MKTLKNRALIAVAVLTLAACEKVIEVDLDATEPQLVVEAVVTNEADSSYVLLTRSGDFYASNDFEAITNATVTIEEAGVGAYTLTEVAPGLYKHESLVGVPGHTYTLTVVAEGETITGVSTMPENVVTLDSILVDEPVGFANDGSYFVQAGFNDPAETADFYRFKVVTNGEEQDGWSIFDDSFFEGNFATLPLFGFIFEEGDSSTVELLHMDEANYEYFNAISLIASDGGGPGGNAAPANPESMFEGNAIGYFGAYQVSRRAFAIPQKE